ncbi:hypothetical protein T265_09565 [Opisthorchis viverrini]|uniref:Uncharacterized protein n=1 Tax=Opisthorchis viverrini TaxID=6198 RepID=A0A074Z5B6_OPIVI|nr:hypothetical protein T265_09565 [Opisthorchis viverrini]KER22321.1 hypothetical protein T265_09565 [Opisthorchis viverrini]
MYKVELGPGEECSAGFTRYSALYMVCGGPLASFDDADEFWNGYQYTIRVCIADTDANPNLFSVFTQLLRRSIILDIESEQVPPSTSVACSNLPRKTEKLVFQRAASLPYRRNPVVDVTKLQTLSGYFGWLERHPRL